MPTSLIINSHILKKSLVLQYYQFSKRETALNINPFYIYDYKHLYILTTAFSYVKKYIAANVKSQSTLH